MVDIGFPNATVVSVEYKPYPVEILWSNRDYDIDSKQLYIDTAALIYENHKNTPINPKSKKNVGKNLEVSWPGYDVWLCFCPGQKTVLSIANNIQHLLDEEESIENNLEVVAISGQWILNII